MFVGHLGPVNGFEIDDLLVWQAIACPPEQAVYVQSFDTTDQWLSHGATDANSLAASAVTWAARAKPVGEIVGPQWIHDLGDGVVIKAVAISRPRKNPFQWWDADGAPVITPIEWARQQAKTDRCIALEVSDPTLAHIHGGTYSSDNITMAIADGRAHALIAQKDPNDDAPINLQLGFGTGAWENAGSLKIGHILQDGAATYHLLKVDSAGHKSNGMEGSVLVDMKYTALPDIDVTLAPVDKTGADAPSIGLQSPPSLGEKSPRPKTTAAISISTSTSSIIS